MNKLITKFWDKIIVVLLGVVGLSGMLYSCMKYGMPPPEYVKKHELRGVVTDTETSNPIQNIRIISNRDTVYTNIKGEYAFDFWSHSPGISYMLNIEDIDGEENGGEFKSQEIYGKFTREDQVENSGGLGFSKTQNIQLEHKK